MEGREGCVDFRDLGTIPRLLSLVYLASPALQLSGARTVCTEQGHRAHTAPQGPMARGTCRHRGTQRGVQAAGKARQGPQARSSASGSERRGRGNGVKASRVS